MEDNQRQELLEIYKLHAELADRVSQRREGANKLYASLLTGILIFLAAFLRYGTGIIPVWLLLFVTGVLGSLFSVSWFIVIRSYRQLNTIKFEVLHKLEEKLAYTFFKREWNLLEKGENKGRYRKLTVVETGLPIIFSFLFLALIVIAFYKFK